MILYIHGFGGTGLGVKASIFREHYKDKDFIAPSLSYVPDLAIATLEEMIDQFMNRDNKSVELMGSSLGGYYAIYLSNKYNIPSVLINPSTNPTYTLDSSKVGGLNYYDQSNFEWNSGHVDMLKKYEVKEPKSKLHLLLTQKGDETLDYSKAVEKLEGAKMIIEEGGSHSFEAIEQHFQLIEDFFSSFR